MTDLYLAEPKEHPSERAEHELRTLCDGFLRRGAGLWLREILEDELSRTPRPVRRLNVQTVAAE